MNSAEYLDFLKKFETKKTTDDCYTPPNVYDAVKNWAVQEYNLQGREIVRPFHPGGDYQKADYSDGKVVIDNPPFSILSEIVRWLEWRRVDYFLFAPTVTLFGFRARSSIVANCSVTYENGAEVKTSFITSMDEYKVRSAPDLQEAVNLADKATRNARAKELPKYKYPANLITAARLNTLANVSFKIGRDECSEMIRALEHQKREGKGIFGGGYLISDAAAAEIKAAEIKAAEIKAGREVIEWRLEPAELEVIARLNKGQSLP